jgi:branched-chain amino acid transport system ATP-binding protein
MRPGRISPFPFNRKEIFEVIRQLNQSGTTVLLVEQNARAALKIAHYSYVLERGEIVLEGLAAELLDNPKVREVYLGG